MVRSWSSLDEFEAFLNDGGIVEADDAMPDEYRHAVFKFIELHANSELMGGLTERDWIPRTPGLRHKMAVIAKTQDEFGHGHLLYMVAADLGVKTRSEMLEDLFAGRSRFHNVFHYRVKTWAQQVAVAFLVDAAALASQQAVFKNCSYGPYRRILKRIISEEGFHMRLGEDRMMRLAEGTEIQRALFQDAIDDWWWPALQLFGPDSKPNDQLLRWHIKSERNEVLRHRWVQKFVPLLHSYGFTVPDPGLMFDETTNEWVCGEIDWEPLKATFANTGPDSGRRISEAAGPLATQCVGARRPQDRPTGSSMNTTTDRAPIDEISVYAAIASVDDPEYPGVSIVDLGLLESITIAGSTVSVGLIPTFTGCPALAVIAEEVRAEVAKIPNVADVEVNWLTSPTWTTDRISHDARRVLAREFTVAVEIGSTTPACPRCGSATDEQSIFGPSRCRSVHRCPSCRETVEVMRS